MDMGQALRTAIGNLRANRLRCLQAMLAMVVGVASVVVILGVGGSLINLNGRRDNEYTPGLISTFVGFKADGSKRITEEDMEQVMRANPDVISAISPFVYLDFISQIRTDDRVFENPKIIGVNDSYVNMYPVLHLQEGRFLQYMDISREQKVCVVGSDIANDLFNGDALGQSLKILGENYTIIGVFAEVPLSADLNAQLLIPYTNARKIVGPNINSYGYNVERYFILANGEENIYETTELLREMMEQHMGVPGGYIVDGAAWTFLSFAASSIYNLMQGALYQMIYFGLLAAAVVLFIGGVGIMNVMLAAVQERTKEIGIRKAFGATVKDIKRQFFMESVIISLIGGLLGFVLGLAVIFLAAFGGIVVQVYSAPNHVLIADMDFLTFGIPILVVLAVCIGIGVVFGTYPAQQAAKMEIVDAINES